MKTIDHYLAAKCDRTFCAEVAGAFVSQDKLTITWVSPAWCQMFGIEAHEVYGKHVNIHLPSEAHERHIKVMEGACQYTDRHRGNMRQVNVCYGHPPEEGQPDHRKLIPVHLTFETRHRIEGYGEKGDQVILTALPA